MIESFHCFGKSPTHQNALDLFKDEWSSRLPDASGLVASLGPVRAFEDYRVEWYEPFVGGFQGKRVLELGPLEGAHAYMLEKRGASEVLSIEANTRAFVKCLIIKEAFDLKRVRFMLGDFILFLRETQEHFGIIFASGVLYHQGDPVEFLRLVCSRCDNVFIWTHCYHAEAFARMPEVTKLFAPEAEERDVAGFRHKVYRRSYAEGRQWKGFCGGSALDACWMSREDIVGALKHFGFSVKGLVEEFNNPNGPALLIAATREHA